MKRLTTNCPDNNLDAALNLFYIKDSETWVRGGGDGPDYPDIRLYDFIRKAARILLPDLEFPMDDDGVDYAMGELLLDGPDEPTGLLALLYTAAWSYAELRGRLMQYEDTRLTPEQCENAKVIIESAFSDDTSKAERIRELLKADKDGRLVVMPCKVGDTVYRVITIKGQKPVLLETRVETLGKAADVATLIGKKNKVINVFLTREEAEKALEAMKDG